MSFRSLNQRILAPAAQSLMIFGIISLCQPWSLLLHQYGVTLTLVGLVAFMITSKIAPEPEPDEAYFDDVVDTLEIHGEHADRRPALEDVPTSSLGRTGGRRSVHRGGADPGRAQAGLPCCCRSP